MTTPSYHIPMGMMKVVAEPAMIKTVVSVGFVLAASYRSITAGGMVHLGMRPHLPASRRVVPDERSITALHSFLTAVEKVEPDLARATIELFGGADILRTSTRGQQAFLRSSITATIEGIIRKRGGELTRADIGGNNSREISLLTSSGIVEVSVVGGSDALKRPPADGHIDPTPRRASWDEAARILKSHVSKSTPTIHVDELSGRRTVMVNMGCMHVDRRPNRLVALLGSCVGIALMDPLSGVGGLAHVMLPENHSEDDKPAKYANTAVPALIAGVVRAGARRDRLKALIAGGANTLGSNPDGLLRIATHNIEGVRAALKAAKIGIRDEDLGGTTSRKMRVDLWNCKMHIKLLGERHER